jgi:hypothetical protein
MIAQADGKYFWNLWRPVTAIREADTDGNPATEPDRQWLPFEDQSILGGVFKGGAGAEYPAGHPAVAGAIVRTLQDFFDTDSIPGGRLSAFSFSSGTTRSFTTFSQIGQEVIDARVYVGVHYRSSAVEGANVGHEVGDYGFANYFQRCDRTVSGSSGSLTVNGGVTCLAPGSTVTGSIAITGGGSLIAANATIANSIAALNARTVLLRATTVGGSIAISRATRQVVITKSDLRSQVALTANSTASAPIVVAGNTIGGNLACVGNQPPPTNDGLRNAVAGYKAGQCTDL